MKIRNLIVLVTLLILLIATTGLTTWIYQITHSSVEEEIDQKLFNAAVMAKNLLPEGYHDRITGKNSVSDAEHLQIVERFNQICKQTGLEYLWSLMILDGRVVFTTSTSPGKNAAQRDQAGFLEIHSNPELYTRAFESMQPQYQVNADKWGRIRAVLIPAYDALGRKYLMGASERMDRIDTKLNSLLLLSLSVSGVVVLLGSLCSFILANSIVRPIELFTNATAKIAVGDYAGHASLRQIRFFYREIDSLANNFNLMMQALRNREESLRKSEARYRLLTENIQDVVWVLTVEALAVQYISPSVEKLLGYSDQEMMARPLLQLFKPTDQVFLARLIGSRAEKFLSGKEPADKFYTDEVPALHKDGHVVWIEAVTSFYINAESGQLEIRGSVRDINERMRTLETLKESEEKFRSITEQTSDLIALTDSLGTLTYASPAARNLFYLTPAEMCGRNFREFLAPETLAAGVAAFKHTLGGGEKTENLELVMRRADGSTFVGELTGSVFWFGGQNGTLVTIRDISARRQTEQALRLSEEQHRLLIQNLRSAVVVHAPDTSILLANQEAARLLGLSPEQLQGKVAIDPAWHFIREDGSRLPLEEYPVSLTLARRQALKEYVIGINRPSTRDRVWVLVNAYPEFDDQQQVRQVVTTFLDITERKLAEEKIRASQVELQELLAETEHSRQVLLNLVEDQKAAEEQIRELNNELERKVAERTAQLTAANRELEAFAYSVSHDLRAPLRALDGFSDFLLSDYAAVLDETGQGYLRRIREASRRMGTLINDLLNLSRITRVEFNRQPVDLSAIAERIATELRAQAPERNVLFEIAPGMQAEGDPNLLKIALENLLNNAFKFTTPREKAVITVGCRETGEGPVYFVRDNGTGFNMEYAGKLFAPFQRLHSANEFPGTGIGLSIVQRVILRHGGRIWPEASAGAGATFYFTLHAPR